MRLEGLKFTLDDNFKGGQFEVIITEITKGLSKDKLLPQMRIDLKIFDSEAEAEALAAAGAAAKGKKK